VHSFRRATLAAVLVIAGGCSSFTSPTATSDAAAPDSGTGPSVPEVGCAQASCRAPSFCCGRPTKDMYVATYACADTGCAAQDEVKILCDEDRDCTGANRCCARIDAFHLTLVACAPTCDGDQNQHVCAKGDSSTCGAGKSCVPAESLLDGRMIPSAPLFACER
jgi:hypothetical protein